MQTQSNSVSVISRACEALDGEGPKKQSFVNKRTSTFLGNKLASLPNFRRSYRQHKILCYASLYLTVSHI